MKTLTMLVGPPGSGKSTMADQFLMTEGDLIERTVYVNQDSQGKFQHMENFREALREGKDVIVDRMNFNKAQRSGYLEQAKKLGYRIVIHVLHVPYAVCMERALARKYHETIKDETSARQAINFFFKSYERVEDSEADEVHRHWPEGEKPEAVLVDLDGTLCDCSHRRHWVRGEGKKNWTMFFAGIPNDKPNRPVVETIRLLANKFKIVYCSGRGEDQRAKTEEWLLRHGLNCLAPYSNELIPLLMRKSGDSRQDAIVKEIILDFEILSRYTPVLSLDDRNQVVTMWRKRGIPCFQVDEGDF